MEENDDRARKKINKESDRQTDRQKERKKETHRGKRVDESREKLKGEKMKKKKSAR